MKVERKGHTTTIKNTQYNTAEFYQKFANEYNSYKSQNLIIDLSFDKSIALTDVKLFLDMAKSQKNEKKSLVLVTSAINLNDVPAKLIVVPTILEAHDIIEMEEIERDLGF